MKAFGTWEQRGFAITLIFIAVIVNSVRSRTFPRDFPFSSKDGAPPVSLQVASEQAAAHAKDLDRYLNVPIARKPGTRTVAVAVVTENGQLNRTVADALAVRFKSETVDTPTTLFTPEFVSDGLFAQTFDDARAVCTRLDLRNSLDAIIFARQTVEYSQDPSLDNVLSAHMSLEVTALSVAVRGNDQKWTFRANGAGFKRDDARAMAEQRLIDQIATNTEMSLRGVVPNNL